MPAEELKPCPFCGAVPEITLEPTVIYPDNPHVLSCECGIQLVLPYDSDKDAIYEQWNCRADTMEGANLQTNNNVMGEHPTTDKGSPCISCGIVTTNVVHLCKSCEGNFE